MNKVNKLAVKRAINPKNIWVDTGGTERDLYRVVRVDLLNHRYKCYKFGEEPPLSFGEKPDKFAFIYVDFKHAYR